MILLLILISWLLAGFIATVIICIPNMRGKEFDSICSFNDGEFIKFILLGYLSLIISLFFIIYKKKLFAKLIFKIVNIGVKTKEKEWK